MIRMDDTVWCSGCGVEITWGPVLAHGRRFCCRECSEGERCDCGVRMEIVEDSFAGQLSPSEPSNESRY